MMSASFLVGFCRPSKLQTRLLAGSGAVGKISELIVHVADFANDTLSRRDGHGLGLRGLWSGCVFFRYFVGWVESDFCGKN